MEVIHGHSAKILLPSATLIVVQCRMAHDMYHISFPQGSPKHRVGKRLKRCTSLRDPKSRILVIKSPQTCQQFPESRTSMKELNYTPGHFTH